METSTAVPRSFGHARALLHHARRARGIGQVQLCVDLSIRAYAAAQEADDYETLYHACACVGRMHRYRAEHVDAYAAFKKALREVESNTDHLRHWLAPALHDCCVEAMSMDDRESARPHAAQCMDLWRENPEGVYLFLQDLSYLRMLRGEEDARHVHHVAAQAAWIAKGPFERMCMFATQALSAGSIGHERWFDSARKRFDYAVNELGGVEEGVAINMLDVAKGAEALRRRDQAMDYAAVARRTAMNRGESILVDRAEEILMRMGVVQFTALLITSSATVMAMV